MHDLWLLVCFWKLLQGIITRNSITVCKKNSIIQPFLLFFSCYLSTVIRESLLLTEIELRNDRGNKDREKMEIVESYKKVSISITTTLFILLISYPYWKTTEL